MGLVHGEPLLALILALPFIGSLCAAFLPSHARNAAAWLSGGIALATAVLVAGLYPAVASGTVLRVTAAWMPQYGLRFYLRMDGFAWLFALLVTFIGALVALYARYYMSSADPVPRFFSFLLAFMGSMLGIVLSGNLIQLVLFWEVTSLTSFMLIGYWYHRADARRGARMSLMMTATGGLCLLAGVLMLGHMAGSYDLDRVLAAGARIRADPWYPAMLALIVLGALTKSAQFPFHFWLPNAMAAPTPVSAYLHSATMVKAGVFLLARLWPVLAGTDAWFAIVGGAGLCSLLLGAFAALYQRDMKGVLAYSTISHLGLITLLLGMNSRLALIAAVFHMMNHATFKASLFMAAGIVDHETGTRDLERLSGLYRVMPITATLALVAAAAMAGVPLLNGFLSKEMFFAETVYAGYSVPIRIGLPALATLAGMGSVAYSLRFMHQVFFGPPAHDLPRTPHEPQRWMLAPSALLVLICLLVGIMPQRTVGGLLQTAAGSILGTSLPVFNLAIWHGFTPALVMSILALAGGVILYLAVHRLRANGYRPLSMRLDGACVFERITLGLIRASRRLMQALSSSRLQLQLLLIICVAIAAAILALGHHGLSRGTRPALPASPLFALLWLIGAACAVGAAVQAKFHRLAALLMLGGTGLVVCLTFAWLSAPDLALTQVAVEIVTTILLLLGLRWMPRPLMTDDPRRRTVRARARRARDLVVALAAGAGLATLAYALMTRPAVPRLAPFFLATARQSGGHNVVNIILVDFRGFDTLGEITVVAIVALGVYALLRRFRPAPESIHLPHAAAGEHPPAAAASALQPHLPQGDMQTPAALLRLLLPLAVLVSLFFLFRGHNAPGGGFVGGLVAATAVIAQYMADGTRWIEARTYIRPQSWIALGLLAAALAGIGAWLASRTFLTSMAQRLHLPLIGEIHLSSTLLFDLGVYLVVIGATVLMLISLAHQSVRSHRLPAAAAEAPPAHTPPSRAQPH